MGNLSVGFCGLHLSKNWAKQPEILPVVKLLIMFVVHTIINNMSRMQFLQGHKHSLSILSFNVSLKYLELLRNLCFKVKRITLCMMYSHCIVQVLKQLH